MTRSKSLPVSLQDMFLELAGLFPLALLLAAAAVAAFIWATRTGQLDDLDTPALRVLHDDDEREPGDGDDSPPPPRNEAG